MIPKNYILEWADSHSWPEQNQVEQDLLISRILVEIFSDSHIAESLAFRGGTALYKLFLTPSPRYSEDIDLVQVRAEPIGKTLDCLRAIIDPLLGTPKRKLGRGLATIIYRYQSEELPPKGLRLKIEINTREHFSIMGFSKKLFFMNSLWFKGEAEILTYTLEELMGTKLRALYQRNKGRDLFDFWYTLHQNNLDVSNVLKVFHHYMDKQGLSVSRAQFEQNLVEKIQSKVFLDDTPPLLKEEVASKWDPHFAGAIIQERVISQLSGEPWKGE